MDLGAGGVMIYHRNIIFLLMTLGYQLENTSGLRFNYRQPIPGGGQFFQWLPNFHEGRILGYILQGTPIGSTVNNCIAANGVMNSAPINVNSCANVVTSSPTQAFVVENEIENPKSGYLAGDTLTFNLFGGISEVTGLDQINPTVIGLPPELDYISYTSTEMWGNPFGGTNLQPTFTKIDNYLGTGQTFLRFKYNYTVTRQSDKTGKTFRVQIKAKIKSGVPSGTYQNRSYQTSELGGEVLGSLLVGLYDPALYGTHIDINNMDGDGFSNDTPGLPIGILM
ncbi:MAG: hypothetical protein IPH28_17035 [Cytophagaceae bacterium]|nr:hypothetical protein [Cytophagaceae bacterium]